MRRNVRVINGRIDLVLFSDGWGTVTIDEHRLEAVGQVVGHGAEVLAVSGRQGRSPQQDEQERLEGQRGTHHAPQESAAPPQHTGVYVISGMFKHVY